MKVKAVEEIPHRPSPFNPNARWLGAQWQGDEVMSVEIEVGDFLYSLVRAVKPVTILETGTWKGFSTTRLATGLFYNGFGTVTTVDKLDQKFIPFVLSQQEVEHHGNGVKTWEKITDDALHAMQKLIDEKRQFNMIFCDDLHSGEHVKKELALFEKLITKPGYLLFHDSYFTKQGDIAKLVKEWAKEKGYDYLPLYTSRGLDIVHVPKN